MEKLTAQTVQNALTPTRESSLQSSSEIRRKGLIARQFKRMALAANQEMPAPERLALLVENAYPLWKEIPDLEIGAAVEAAIIEAGAFMATAGLVVKCWRKDDKKELVLDGTHANRSMAPEVDSQHFYADRYWAEVMRGRYEGPRGVEDFRRNKNPEEK